MRAILSAPLLLLCAACAFDDNGQSQELAQLKAEVAALKARPQDVGAPVRVELGQQMLELQIRHARLWQATQARNWMLAQFQLAELRESLNGVVELNGDHAALQPRLLSDVLPEKMTPALDRMQEAVDEQDAAGLDSAYDAISAACTDCHAASSHGFLVIQRPRTPMLDNLKATATP